MPRLGRIRFSHIGRVLALIAAIALVLLVQVSATLANPVGLVVRLERDLAALRVQLDTLPERFIETAFGELSFNTAIGNGDPDHRWQMLIAMTRSAQRGARGLEATMRSLSSPGANERADLALLIGVQLSTVQQAMVAWREADTAEAARARSVEALERAEAVLATLRSEPLSIDLASPAVPSTGG